MYPGPSQLFAQDADGHGDKEKIGGTDIDGSRHLNVASVIKDSSGNVIDSATEAKQDDIIENTDELEGFASDTKDNQTSGDQKTQIVDASGNVITSSADADGAYYLGTAVIQNIITSTGSSTTTNLASGATFTGTAEETFGINGIQVFHAADQNCTIYIDQSIDNTFPATSTITDSFPCLADTPCSRTFTSVSPYYRMRVKNNGASTTTSLSTFTGMTPIINPLPRALTEDGRLMGESTLVGRENTERHVWVSPTNELASSPVYRMVGTSFTGSTKDPNFWTDGSLRDGTVTQDGGEVELETNTTANGLALYQSVRKSRFVAGSAQYFNGGFNFVTAGTADNTRRIGAYTLDGSLDVEDGFYFQLAGTTFSIGYARAGTPTLVNSGSFNGNYGVNFVPTADTYYKFAIEFTPLGAFWYVNGKLLHKISQAHMADTLTLPITLENENTGDSTTDVTLDCIGTYIARQGELYTNPTSKYMSGTGVTVCKYGAGTLKGIVISAIVNGADINIYDGTAITDTLIWASGNQGARTEPLVIDFFGLPFSDGLTIEIADSAADVLAVYE